MYLYKSAYKNQGNFIINQYLTDVILVSHYIVYYRYLVLQGTIFFGKEQN